MSSIFERAMSYDDANNIIAVRDMTKKEIKIVLYDYVTKSIHGYVWATNFKNEYFIVERISADKGWGPFLYELLMQSIYPLGLKPSEMIRPEAINVWKKFQQNSNIETEPITSTSLNYAVAWKPDEFAEPIVGAPELQIINQIFKLHPYNYFRPYMEESENIIKNNNISKTVVFKHALDFFQSKYYVESFVLETLNIPNKDVTDKYLIVNKENSTIQFLIQDKSKIFGYAELTNDGKYYQTKNIAAETGWGPFLYDTVMLMLDKPIHPSESLTTDSFTVINNYLHNRPDVIKSLYPGKLYTAIDLNNRMNHEEKYYKVLNYTYTINNVSRRETVMNWYNQSLKFEQQLTASLPNWKNIRFQQAKRWFNMQYLSSAA